MQRKLDSEPLRTRIYIDGYNFYYGCLRGTPYKWLDLLPLFEKHILPSILVTDSHGQIRASRLLESPSIKYFTAKIIESVARAGDSVSSQARYHTALRKLHDGRGEYRPDQVCALEARAHQFRRPCGLSATESDSREETNH
ncbi:hypothetical protein PPUN110474_18020 [Pseudomonas putida]|nr:hypothetical protein PPUN110474_18020 [Pseudomonas putida]